MTYDFQHPQKQSGLGILVLFFDFVIKLLRALFLPALYLIIRGSFSSIGIMLLILLGIFIIALVNAYLSYKYLTYYIDSEKQELVVQKGFLKKELVTIKLDKIQQVNLNQNFIQKVLDLYAIQIDTAGGDASEVDLKALEEPIALALKAALLEREDNLASSENATDIELLALEANLRENFTNKPVMKLTLKTLFKIGISSNYGSTLAILFGFIVTMANQLREWRELWRNQEENFSDTFQEGLQFFSTGMLFSFLLIALIGIHVFRTFYTYSNFEMSLKNMALHLSSGLFSKKSTHLKPKNVQITSISQNYFQHLLGIVEIQLKQASGLKVSHDNTPKQSHLVIPGANTEERNEIIALVLNQEPEAQLTLKSNYRYMFMPIFFYIGIPILALSLFNYFGEPLGIYNWLSIPYTLFMAFFIYRSFKNHLLSISSEYIILQSGAWDVTKSILLPTKIQGIKSYQYFWHKALNIGHMEIYTAGGSLNFRFGNFSDIQKLKNNWLMQVEQTDKDWN